MSKETLSSHYPVYFKENFQKKTLREVASLKKEVEPESFVWSARLSSGIFGLPGCPSGNSDGVPKGENEVVLAISDEGLNKLINLGFVPCPTCHPENTSNFWEKAAPAILKKFPHLESPEEILDRNKVPFDSARLNWEEMSPYLSLLPSRLYLPPNLSQKELVEFRERLLKLSFQIPPMGFYDRTSPKRFTEYAIYTNGHQDILDEERASGEGMPDNTI